MKKDPVKLTWLFLGSLIVNTGISFIWPLTTIYMHEYLHEPLTVAGLVLLVNSAFTVVGNFLGGWLFDHWHPYQTITVGVIISTISAGLLIFFHGWPTYAFLLITIGLGNGIVNTCINSTATLIKSKQTSYVFNVLYFTSNLGLVFGSLIVGFILPLGITYIFALAFILFAGFTYVVLTKYKALNDAKAQVKRASVNVPDSGKTREKPAIILVLICLFTAWIAYEQWQSNISTYMLGLNMSVQSYSFLWTLNALIIVTFQPLLTHFDDFLTKHLRGRLYAGFLLFSMTFLVLIKATHYSAFLAAIAVLTFGEILAFPAVSTFVNNRASLAEKGKYQGFVMATASAGRAVGPLIGALVIESASYQVLFYFCTILVIAAVALFGLSHLYKIHKKGSQPAEITENHDPLNQ